MSVMALVLAFVVPFLCQLSGVSARGNNVNYRPIVGILAEPPQDGPGIDPTHSFFPADYVRWLSAAGARVAVLRYDMPEHVLRSLFDSVNAILYIGGDDSLLPETQYFKTSSMIYHWAIEANKRGDYFPLWGTCQGFQLLSVLAAQDQSVLLHNHYDSYNYSIPIVLTPKAASSRLFNGLSHATVTTLTTMNVTENLHHNGVLPESYTKNTNLASIFNLLSVNTDRKGTPFGSTMEGKNFPFYAVQWHPERNQFDWGPREGLNKTPEAIMAMQDLSNFFVGEARKNFHKFPSVAEEQKNLIYQWQPTYTGDEGNYPEIETYHFPLWSDEETRN